MSSAKPGDAKGMENICHICHGEISPGEDYEHSSETLCESCYMDVRTPRVRKTHWQYLGSINTGYLIPSPKAGR